MFIDEWNSISPVVQGRKKDEITRMPQVIIQSNIGGLRPTSDVEVDQLIDQCQNSIMSTTSVMIAEESWVCSHFNEEKVRQCTLSIGGLPESHPSPSVTQEAVVRTVHDMVLRIATSDHDWPFAHTGLLGWRCQWSY